MPPPHYIGRFAPSTTGQPHPGTLLCALLTWLDARANRGAVHLRLEDIDRERARPEWATSMHEALAWLGLKFDGVHVQSDARAQHLAQLRRLVSMGVVYRCTCSRSDIRAMGHALPDGGFGYGNRCRAQRITARELDACIGTVALRVALPAVASTALPAAGDPVVLRHEGAVAYHLASVVDDAVLRVTHVVRGRDLLSSAQTQTALRALLKFPEVIYRHHFLLLETHGEKLAKLHGSIGQDVVAQRYSGAEFCGWLAQVAGLREEARACTPESLIADYHWDQVSTLTDALVSVSADGVLHARRTEAADAPLGSI